MEANLLSTALAREETPRVFGATPASKPTDTASANTVQRLAQRPPPRRVFSWPSGPWIYRLMQTEVRLRFCLRTFMIVMTAVSISFGLLSAHLRHKAMTVAKIESRGGVVLYDTAVPTPHRSFINRAAIDSPHIGPWVRQPVIIIFPHEVSVTDKDLRLVSRLGSVETVHLAARESSGVTSLNKVTELGLAYLERLPRLRQLSLCGAGVSEAAVAQFRLRRPKCYVAQRPGEPVLLVQR